MSIYLGSSEPSKIYVGSSEVSAVYVGTQQVRPKSITDGYYDMITDSFYYDESLTNLITPKEGYFYKHIRYTTPIFFKYTNGQYIIQKKNDTTVTKNTTLSLTSADRYECLTWGNKGKGFVCGCNNSYAHYLTRTDIDSVSISTRFTAQNITSGAYTKQGTIGLCSFNNNVWQGTPNYSGNSISLSSKISGGTGWLNAAIVNKSSTYIYCVGTYNTKRFHKLAVDSSGNLTVATSSTDTSSLPGNICGGACMGDKIYLSNAGGLIYYGTPNSSGDITSWATINPSFSSANSMGSDRKNQLFVGGSDTSTLRYSLDGGANWSSLTTQQNTGGEIYVDDIGDIWIGTETSLSSIGWVRFGTFLTEEELA